MGIIQVKSEHTPNPISTLHGRELSIVALRIVGPFGSYKERRRESTDDSRSTRFAVVLEEPGVMVANKDIHGDLNFGWAEEG
jgi:hypothetical protein